MSSLLHLNLKYKADWAEILQVDIFDHGEFNDATYKSI